MSERILRDTGATLGVTFYSGETAQNADGAVTVTITRDDGTAVVTGAATTNAGTGVYQYVLAPQTNLDLLTAAWSGSFGGVAQKITTRIEVAGGFYVSIPEIRALPGLTSTTSFPTDKLKKARDWFENLAEAYCGV